MPSKPRHGQERRDGDAEKRKSLSKLAELVGKAEGLLPELQAGVTSIDWQRRAREVRDLACAADPHLDEFTAIEQFERELRNKGLGEDEQRTALLTWASKLSPEEQTVSGACQTIHRVLGFIIEHRNCLPTEAIPKAHAAISGAIQSLKELLPKPLAGEETATVQQGEILRLKPELWGMSVDLKALWRWICKYRHNKARRRTLTRP